MSAATATLRAYHGDAAIKDKYLARVREHAAADELIQGTGWKNGKGCAVGCTFHVYDHARGPVEIGVPEELMRLDDAIFEGLQNGDAKVWPQQFLDAIPVGADLSMVWPRFALWLLSDKQHGVLRFADDSTREAIEDVIALYRDWCETGSQPEMERFASAAGSAAAAAESAAGSAAGSAARSAAAAAESAAWSAAGSAESAAWSTAEAAKVAEAAAMAASSTAAAAWAARTVEAAGLVTAMATLPAAATRATAGLVWSAAASAHWIACRDKLLELLATA